MVTVILVKLPGFYRRSFFYETGEVFSKSRRQKLNEYIHEVDGHGWSPDVDI
jgi:hypothetical protein